MLPAARVVLRPSAFPQFAVGLALAALGSLLGFLPELLRSEVLHVVHCVMAAARQARTLVRDQIVVKRNVRGLIFKRTRTQVAVQTFTIVVCIVEMDLFRSRNLAEVLNVEVSQAPDLRSHTAVQHVVCMAGVT